MMILTGHSAFALIPNVITGIVLILSVSRDQVTGLRHHCGNVLGPGATTGDNVTGGYTLTVRHERLNPYIDLLPNMTYTVEIEQKGSDRKIHALELDISYDGFGDTNGSDVHDMPCENLHIPVRIKWIPQISLESCVRLRAIVWENETNGFNISLEICKPKGCRQYYNAYNGGTVLSPGFPVKYADNYNCTYVIYTPNQHQVRLQFRSFELEPAYDGKCFDAVLIHCRNNTTTLCGARNNTGLNDLNFHSDDGILYLTFVTDFKVVARGFDAYYYTTDKDTMDGCSYTMSNLTGQLYSPNYPDHYFPMMKCIVQIALPTRFRISLHLQYLDLDISRKLGECSNNEDTLRIIQDSIVDENNFYFCGSKIHYSRQQLAMQSSRSRVFVIFQSYSLHESKGFMLQYSAIESCKNTTYHNITNGNFASVNFPANYLNNQNCVLSINVKEHSGVLELKFKYFHTVSSENDACMNSKGCIDDYVEIDTEGIVTRMCGHCTQDGGPLLFYSSSRFIMVRFVSNGHLTRSGYSGQWRLVDTIPSDDLACPTMSIVTDEVTYDVVWEMKSWSEANVDCGNRGGLLASIPNIVTQQLIDKFLKDNSNCSNQASSFWIGAGDYMYEGDYYWADLTRLNFTYWFEGWPEYGFDIKQPSDDGLSGEDCVEIRNSFPLPVKGVKATRSYYWNDRNCLLKNPYICQRSKHGGTSSPGWDQLITATDVDVNMDSQERIVIHSPHFPRNYDDFTDTAHHISSSNPFHRIHVYFEAFDLEPSQSCIYDNLTLSSFSTTSPDIVRCGDWNTNIKLMEWTSQRNRADLRFRSDNSVSASGFQLSVVTREDPRCREAFHDMYHKLVGDSKIMLLSDDLSCYLLMPRATESYTNARLTCAEYSASLFHHTTNDQCSLFTKALRSIYPASLCGMWNVRLSGKSCLEKDDVMSYTDCHVPRPFICVKGHHVKDPVHIRKDVLRTTTGQLKWPDNIGHLYDNNLHHEYEIHATDGNRIFITVESLSIEYQEKCLYDYLSITEIMGNSTILCGNKSTIQTNYFLSIEQLIKIVFHTDSSIGDHGFELSWKWINDDDCILVNNNSNSESISSINYPLPYPGMVHCCKSFKCAIKSRIIVIFNSISILHNESDPALVVYIGKRGFTLPYQLNATLPVSQRTVISDKNSLRLCLNMDSIEENGGFSGIYSRSSEESIRVSETIEITPNQRVGIIQSLHFPNSAPRNYKQIIHMTTDIGYNIQLEFTNISHMNSLRYNTYLEITDTSLGHGYHKPIVNLTADSTLQEIDVFRSHLNSMQVTFATGFWSDNMFQARYTVIRDDHYLEKTKSLTDGTLSCCGNDTCFSGGVCVNLENGRFTCKCGANLTGLFCQTSLCDLFPCVHGGCIIEDGAATCECESDKWGEHCNMTNEQCNDYRCYGHGVCAQSKNHPMCVCTEQWTGDDCSLEKPMQKQVMIGTGEKLLNEPIWIGMIVVLSLVFAFTSMFIVRRRCEKKLKCCKETKSTEIGQDKGEPDGLIENNYPCLGDKYKHYRYQANDQDLSLENKEGEDEGQNEIESPDINFGNHRAAAKLFASYNNRQSDYTVPVMEKRPSMLLEKDSEDSVGGMKGGTLNFCTTHDMSCEEISENEIAGACFDAAVPILKISEIGMSSLENDYLDTFKNKSSQIDRELSPDKTQHCYPEIVVVDATPTHLIDDPGLRLDGSHRSLEMPSGGRTEELQQIPFRLLDVGSKRKRFASKLRVERSPFDSDSQSLPHSSRSTANSNNSTDLPDTRDAYACSEYHGHTSYYCNRLDPRQHEHNGRARSMGSYEDIYGTGTSEYGTDPTDTDQQGNRQSVWSMAKTNSREDLSCCTCNNGCVSERKLRLARVMRRRRGYCHSHEKSSAKSQNMLLSKTSSDSNLQYSSKVKHKHRRSRKKQNSQQCQSIQRMLQSSMTDDTVPTSASKMSVRKSRSNDLVPNHMTTSPCRLQNNPTDKVVYAQTVQRRHSYHTKYNSDNVYDPDIMLNTDQSLAYRLEKSENDLPRLPPFSSYKVVEESPASSDVSGMFSTNTNTKETLKIPLTSDTDTGFWSSSRSLLSPYGGRDDADIDVHSVEKVNRVDSAYQTKENSHDIKTMPVPNQDSQTINARKETNVIVRLQQAAIRLQTLSSSGDSAVQTTLSEDELDDAQRPNKRRSEYPSQKEGLEEVSEEHDITGHIFNRNSLINDGSLQVSVFDIELQDFSCV